MNCAEFQKELPDIIESGGNAAQQAHLNSCPVCTDLVKDLKYIAEAAKLLVPMEDPSPRVWQGIEKSLKNERPLRPAGGPERIEPFLIPSATRGNFLGLSGIAAVLVIALALFAFIRNRNNQPQIAQNLNPPSVASAAFDDDDEKLLSEVSAHAPAMRAAYEKHIRNVNAYISDAKQSVEQNPDDDVARDQLMNAYEQKASLYEMAMDRTTQ